MRKVSEDKSRGDLDKDSEREQGTGDRDGFLSPKPRYGKWGGQTATTIASWVSANPQTMRKHLQKYQKAHGKILPGMLGPFILEWYKRKEDHVVGLLRRSIGGAGPRF